MDITGKIIQILPMQEFASKKDGSVYHKYAFVLETQEVYPKKVYLTCFGDDKWAQLNIKPNDAYNIQFDLASREVNGRWYTEASCWRAVPLGQAQTQKNAAQATQVQQTPSAQSQATHTPHPQPQPQQSTNDDLPF